MNKTVLITGTSSGIGKAAVLEFAKNGWRVIATQRNIDNETSFKEFKNVRLYPLNVDSPESVKAIFKMIRDEYGTLDVLINNAGFAVDGVFEAYSDENIRRQFETNVFGLMRMTREAIHLMRPRRQGIIMQISSMGGRITFPLYSIYHSSKFAVEGFTESLHYELKQFNIKLKLIEPGLIETEFYGRNREFISTQHTGDYDNFINKFNKAVELAMKAADKSTVVARSIYKAATDNSNKLRYTTGRPAGMLVSFRKIFSDRMFFWMIRKSYRI